MPYLAGSNTCVRCVSQSRALFDWRANFVAPFGPRFCPLCFRKPFHRQRGNSFCRGFFPPRINRLWIFRDGAGYWPAFCFSPFPAAIQNFHLIVTEQAERPERVTRPPVRFVP